MIRKVYDSGETKECYAACQDQLYSLLVTRADYPTRTTFKYSKDFCLVVRKLLETHANKMKRKALAKTQPELTQLLSSIHVSTLIGEALAYLDPLCFIQFFPPKTNVWILVYHDKLCPPCIEL